MAKVRESAVAFRELPFTAWRLKQEFFLFVPLALGLSLLGLASLTLTMQRQSPHVLRSPEEEW